LKPVLAVAATEKMTLAGGWQNAHLMATFDIGQVTAHQVWPRHRHQEVQEAVVQLFPTALYPLLVGEVDRNSCHYFIHGFSLLQKT
jgi:hypothetical protein